MFKANDESGVPLQVERDRALARRMLAGDERALKTFCDEYLPKLYRYAMHQLRSRQDVDDVVQAVLSIAARRIETFRGESSLLTWLIGICRREIYRQRSQSARHDVVTSFHDDDVLRAVVESLEAPASDEPQEILQREQAVELIQTTLDHLPSHYAQALELRYLEGHSSKEIAERLHIGDEAAQSLLARARRAFKEVCSEALYALARGERGQA